MPTTSEKQLAEFQRVARELDCNDEDTAFAATLKKIAKAKPPVQGKANVWIIGLGNNRVLGRDGKPTYFLDDARDFPTREKAEAAITPEVRALGGTGYDSVMATKRPV